jgi:hypothetical protein
MQLAMEKSLLRALAFLGLGSFLPLAESVPWLFTSFNPINFACILGSWGVVGLALYFLWRAHRVAPGHARWQLTLLDLLVCVFVVGMGMALWKSFRPTHFLYFGIAVPIVAAFGFLGSLMSAQLHGYTRVGVRLCYALAVFLKYYGLLWLGAFGMSYANLVYDWYTAPYSVIDSAMEVGVIRFSEEWSRILFWLALIALPGGFLGCWFIKKELPPDRAYAS